MKKLVFIFIALLLSLPAGCGPLPEGLPLFGTPSPPPTPTPAPTPVPVVALYGASEDAAFAAGVREAVDEAGFWFSAETGDADALADLDYQGACCAILPVTDADGDLTPLAAANLPVLLYQAGSRALPPGFPGVTVDRTETAEALLAAALSYPPHDTPVRLFGVFESEDSDAYAAWIKGVAEGKILVKAVYIATESPDDPCSDWMRRMLSAFYPGMVDGIYAESAALAGDCAGALLFAGRTDMEVFSCGVDGALRQLMGEKPELIPAAAGVDPVDAGRACGRRAVELLRDGANQNVTRLTPQIYSAAELD